MGFIWWQRTRQRLGRTTLLDLSLFSTPSFAWGNLVGFVVALGQLGLLFVLPLWLQNTLGYSATETGLLLVPVALGAFIAAGTTPLLAARWSEAGVLRVGLIAEIAGLAWLAFTADPETGAWKLVPVVALYGFGVGTADAQLPSLLLRDIPVERSGQGSGVQNTVQELGSAMGIAIIGTVFFASVSADLDNQLIILGLTLDQRDTTTALVNSSAGTVIPSLEGEIAGAARSAFSVGIRNAAFTGAGFLLLGLVATVSLGGRANGKGIPSRAPPRPSSGF